MSCGEALFRRLAVPACRLGHILGHACAGFIAVAQLILGRRVAHCGSPYQVCSSPFLVLLVQICLIPLLCRFVADRRLLGGLRLVRAAVFFRCFQPLFRVGVALLGSQGKPLHRLGRVLGYTVAGSIACSQIALSRCIALLRRSAEPLCRLCIVARNAFTLIAAVAQLVLGRRIIAVCRHLKPNGGCRWIFLDPPSRREALAQTKLRTLAILACCLAI